MDDWPIKIDLESNRSAVNANCLFGVSIKITVGTARYTASEPCERRIVKLGEVISTKKKWGGLLGEEVIRRPKYQYPMSEVEEAILTGIEEAHHALYCHLKMVQKLDVGDADLVDNSVIEVIDSVSDGLSEEDRLAYVLKYTAARFSEYAAEQTQAQYVRKYFPDIWEAGYEDYMHAIRRTRSAMKQKA